MRVIDMMQPEGRVFLKPEFGEISNEWPCVSFTKKSVGERLRREFKPERDILIYVGTSNAATTRNPEHRSRLISAVSIEPRQILETRKIIPPEVWSKSEAEWGKRWPYAMAVLKAASMIGPPFPEARKLIPEAYSSLADMKNWGDVIELLSSEREAVLSLTVESIILHLGKEVQKYLKLQRGISADVPLAVKQHASRMAQLIIDRIKRGGEGSVKINPLRSTPNVSDLIPLLLRKWTDQRGLCALCGGSLATASGDGMLQPSADRVDSENGAYDDANVWITHLACNFAKNKYSIDDFEDWLAVIRGIDPNSEG